MIRYITYKRAAKYQLFDDYAFQLEKYPQEEIYCGRYLHLSETGLLTIQSGYTFDPSGPTIDSLTTIRPSLVHDALYQLIRRGHLDEEEWREYADTVLRDIMLSIIPEKEKETWLYTINRKAHEVRCWYFYKSVRGFGSCAVRSPKKIMEAP